MTDTTTGAESFAEWAERGGDMDRADFIRALATERDALAAQLAESKCALVIWDAAYRTGRSGPLVRAYETGAETLKRMKEGETP